MGLCRCLRLAPRISPLSAETLESLCWHRGRDSSLSGTAQIRPDKVNIPRYQTQDPDTWSTCAKSGLCSRRKLTRIDLADSVTALVLHGGTYPTGAGLEFSREQPSDMLKSVFDHFVCVFALTCRFCSTLLLFCLPSVLRAFEPSCVLVN